MIGAVQSRSVTSNVSLALRKVIQSSSMLGSLVDARELLCLCQNAHWPQGVCAKMSRAPSTLNRRYAAYASPVHVCHEEPERLANLREARSSKQRDFFSQSSRGSAWACHSAIERSDRSRSGSCASVGIVSGRHGFHSGTLGNRCQFSEVCGRVLSGYTGRRVYGLQAFASRANSCRRRRRLLCSCSAADQPASSREDSHSQEGNEVTDKKNQRIVFLGTPQVAAGVLDSLLDASSFEDSLFEVVGIVTQPPSSRGRGRKRGTLLPSPVAELAAERGLSSESILSPEKASEEKFLLRLSELSPDLCVTAAYGNLLPQRFLSIPRCGTLNIHPSLLPLYRGASPVQRALEAGERVSGVSVAFTVLAMDAGPILAQEEVIIDDEIKAPELLENLFRLGTALLLQELPAVFSGDAAKRAKPQDPSKKTTATKVRPEEGQLLFHQDAWVLHNKVRAFAAWPGTKATFRVERADAAASNGDNTDELIVVKIVTTRAKRPEKMEEQTTSNAAEGCEEDLVRGVGREVVFAEDALKVRCRNDSILEILDVQPPGKRAMTAKDFWNGLRGCRIFTVEQTEVVNLSAAGGQGGGQGGAAQEVLAERKL
ncbi:hypothetical protein CBR_g48389 [Chara braunii]|uniref:Methionyl-tRNA formyltransferase, mitochondrial n=1 Tax=Chara braunii TaxID=69332 RepID=A0A388M2J2_CHABU|nr:hypothetical protein CBR_g48389 [Chara braunii]|eukprot:GBG88771.1 hypothetical protein CBR_g48389 [Chara braunii]